MASIDKMMEYALSRWHKPVYLMGGGRVGADASYYSSNDDCSSFVFKAAKMGGFIPESMRNGSTETLFQLARAGKYLKEIKKSEVKRGDIFVKGREGASAGAYGHTGIFTRWGEIIHCNYGNNTITTNNENEGFNYYMATDFYPIRFFRWIGNADPVKTEVKNTDPSRLPKGATFIKYEKAKAIFRLTTNVRSTPNAYINNITGQKYAKDSIIYDAVIEANDYRWLTYITYAGERRYITYRSIMDKNYQWAEFKEI